MSPAPAATREREFEFSDEDFRSLRDLVRELSGITLSDAKRELVYGRLTRRLRALGLGSFRDYRQLLNGPRRDAELAEFTNALTTNLTSFFRERHHFDTLREQLLRPGTRIRLWSAGCSTGEEACSLAMTVAEALPDWQRHDVRILATDLDTSVLLHASAGYYSDERVRTLSAERRERFFTREQRNGATIWRFDPNLARLISYRPLNLMHPLPMRGPIDAIFCRNVIIYFDKDTQRGVFSRLAPLQRPGALLFLGHSESLFSVSDAYELIGRTVHRRVQA